MRSVTILSGGMDSTALAYLNADQGYEQHILSFNYGQRHKKELGFAARTAQRLNAKHDIIDLTSVNRLFVGSSLTDLSKEVPEGHYSAISMSQTVVPNRNAIMLSIAWGVAVAEKANQVSYGAHLGDLAQYPDCRIEFVEAFVKALHLGNLGFEQADLILDAPFVRMSKADIATLGGKLKVPFEKTWSCYKGGEKHCGRCGTCVERIEALNLAGVEDLTEYEDSEYWKTAVAEFEASNRK